MSSHGIKLVKGVREFIRTEKTTLEDLHMVAADIVQAIDKLIAKQLKNLKPGQKIKVYDENSGKNYGQKGADVVCYFNETKELKTRGTILRVYDSKHEWSVATDSLLDVYDDFDPESSEGKKRTNNQTRTKKRGRKPKSSEQNKQIDQFGDFESSWSSSEFEEELEDEEYDLSDDDWKEFFPDDE